MNRALHERVLAANEELLNKGNVDVAPDFFASEYVVHLTDQDLQGGPEAVKDFVRKLRQAFPDIHVEVEILATAGNRIAWQRTHRATFQEDFMGLPASGYPILWRDIVVTRFEDGLIAEEWAVSDLGERLRTS